MPARDAPLQGSLSPHASGARSYCRGNVAKHPLMVHPTGCAPEVVPTKVCVFTPRVWMPFGRKAIVGGVRGWVLVAPHRCAPERRRRGQTGLQLDQFLQTRARLAHLVSFASTWPADDRGSDCPHAKRRLRSPAALRCSAGGRRLQLHSLVAHCRGGQSWARPLRRTFAHEVLDMHFQAPAPDLMLDTNACGESALMFLWSRIRPPLLGRRQLLAHVSQGPLVKQHALVRACSRFTPGLTSASVSVLLLLCAPTWGGTHSDCRLPARAVRRGSGWVLVGQWLAALLLTWALPCRSSGDLW